MAANKTNGRALPGLSRNGKIILTLMGGVLCAEAAMATVQIAYAINPCKIENAAKFVTAGGGCKDVKTGRVWSRNADSPERTSSMWTFTPAKDYCANLVEGGMSDWRMPTRDEMKAVSANGAGAYLDAFTVPNGPPNQFDFYKWSSTTIQGGKYAYVIQLGSGLEGSKGWATNGQSWTDVICVR